MPKYVIPADQMGHYMTVGKLRELLADQPDDLPIILAKDPEGNGYSPFHIDAFDTHLRYQPYTTWSGEVKTRVEHFDPTWSDDPEDYAGEEWGIDCLVFGPTN